MKNPFFRATDIGGNKVDINVNNVNFFTENTDGTTTIHFVNGTPLSVKDSARTVRGATRKAWPKADDAADEAPAAQ